MVTPISIKKAPRKLSPSQIKSLKKLAQQIDTHESQSIKSRGRSLFRRHAAARQIIAQLKTRRLQKGFSLTTLAARTGIAKPNLSRLENNPRSSPTLETLHRYAHALGLSVRIELAGKN